MHVSRHMTCNKIRLKSDPYGGAAEHEDLVVPFQVPQARMLALPWGCGAV